MVALILLAIFAVFAIWGEIENQRIARQRQAELGRQEGLFQKDEALTVHDGQGGNG